LKSINKLFNTVFSKSRNSDKLLEKSVTEQVNEVLKEKENLLIAEYNRKFIEHSNLTKSDFLARMNHEMLTPMNAIIGFAEVAKMSDNLDHIMLMIDKINESSSHMLEMLGNVLDVSDRCGSLTIVESQFVIKTMLKNVLKKIYPERKKKEQKLSIFFSQSIPETLIGDEKRISQVLFHLLINAIKFSPIQSRINLKLDIFDEENEVITLKIEVTDNGIGMSKEQQKDLFDIFEQGNGSKTRKYGGIGIGLPLSKRIANMMGGDIWAESEPGKGSKFTFICKVKKE